NHKDSYSYLSHTYQSLNELFIDRPYGALKREWLSDQFLDSDNESTEQRYRAAVRVFYREIRECEREMLAWIKNGSIGYHTPESLDFIALMGPCLAKPACSIILQFLSESLRFSPPVLSPFDQTIQKLLYAQLITFLEENSLEIPDSEEEQKRLFHMRMEEALLRDIGWIREKGLQTHDTLSLPIRELENYYYGRSLSR
ncbi:MAG: hypothetical protein KDK40_02885, partial [Chlamydiia bacterium]|nr:hypothetical protein [Chlamydiia bacterium]